MAAISRRGLFSAAGAVSAGLAAYAAATAVSASGREVGSIRAGAVSESALASTTTETTLVVVRGSTSTELSIDELALFPRHTLSGFSGVLLADVLATVGAGPTERIRFTARGTANAASKTLLSGDRVHRGDVLLALDRNGLSLSSHGAQRLALVTSASASPLLFSRGSSAEVLG